jgi:allophanate hydrolase
MPLNSQLQERGAWLVERNRTAPDYRLYALAASTPPKPGMVRVADGEGASIELEVWEMPEVEYGSFVALIPTPLGIGRVELHDGSHVQSFLCEQHGLRGATDITKYGGWRAYLASLSPAES